MIPTYESAAFVTLQTYGNQPEAELACAKLKSERIDSYVANTATQMLIGMGTVVPCELKVRRKDLERAREILKEVEVVVVPIATYEPKYEKRRRIGKIMLIIAIGLPILLSIVSTLLTGR